MKRFLVFSCGLMFLLGVSQPASPVDLPKTGQTVSYGIGDDGDIEAGVAWPSPRFTDNADGTVTDNLTKLIYLKNANRFGAKTWLQALNDCNTLADDGIDLTDGSVAGDWRLPNLKELHSLTDYSRYNPALPVGIPFIGVQASYYWSSTTYADITSNAWGISMGDGYAEALSKTSSRYFWPVRGQPEEGSIPPLVGGSGGCFIATVAYGSLLDRHVKALRSFRDRRLLTSPVGRWLVHTYYTISPPVAQWIKHRQRVQALTRIALAPLVAIAQLELNRMLTICLVLVLLLSPLAWTHGLTKQRNRKKFPPSPTD